MKNSSISVSIIEPSEIIARGLQLMIEQNSTINVNGIYPSLEEYEEHSKIKSISDVLIVNPMLIAYNKYHVNKHRLRNTRMVGLLYQYIDNETLSHFHELITINDKPDTIVHTLEAAFERSGSVSATSDVEELSDREKEILIAVAKGMINKEIANMYNISVHTVISHRKNISKKIGIKSVSGFVVYALLNKLMKESEIQ